MFDYIAELKLIAVTRRYLDIPCNGVYGVEYIGAWFLNDFADIIFKLFRLNLSLNSHLQTQFDLLLLPILDHDNSALACGIKSFVIV